MDVTEGERYPQLSIFGEGKLYEILLGTHRTFSVLPGYGGASLGGTAVGAQRTV